MSADAKTTPRLKTRYFEEIRPRLQDRFEMARWQPMAGG